MKVTLRAFSALFAALIALLAETAFAEGLPATAPVPQGTSPVDVVAEHRALQDTYPDASGVRLLNVHGKDLVRFDHAGGATFFPPGAISDLTVTTKVAAMDSNRICLAPTGNWSGVCIFVFARADGSWVCRLHYGNDATGRTACSVRPVQ